MSQLYNIRVYIAIAILLLTSFVGYKEYARVQSLKDEISLRDISISQLTRSVEDMQNELLVEKLKGERYKAAVKEQTQAMEEQGRKLEKSKAELAKWRADVKKYESIEKHLPPKIIVERSNCEDINDYFSGLDSLQ